MRSGSIATTRWVRIGKYCSKGRPFTLMTPDPGRSRTRATASFLRPVLWTRGLGNEAPSARALRHELVRLRLLRRVRMGGTGVDAQPLQQTAPETALGEHPAHRAPHHLLGIAGEEVLERLAAQASRVAGVAVVALVGQ